ncbi:NADPH-dependent FMN reductase [Streptomyces lutosisoli]|uniref:NADPH-dependent FMN reductase n=1 Tax=Streptomyces lutosisoli TaxID=2665721 RepID=A0ABW2VKV1_9ACTN
MSNDELKLAVILSSVRKERFGPVVTNWFTGVAKTAGNFDVDVIDIAEVGLPLEMSHHNSPEVAAALAAVSERLKTADAFVVVTPEYNHSFPASLKNLIDWNYAPWRAKPVGYVSYGGMSGGLRAVEQLRQVYGEMHAVSIRDAVSFQGAQGAFGEDGNPREAEASEGAAKTMLDQLTWWARALKDARSVRPYSV